MLSKKNSFSDRTISNLKKTQACINEVNMRTRLTLLILENELPNLKLSESVQIETPPSQVRKSQKKLENKNTFSPERDKTIYLSTTRDRLFTPPSTPKKIKSSPEKKHTHSPYSPIGPGNK